ncbi:MAG: hypothetical protein WCS34_09485 [Bacteroidales bacterium]
MRPLKQVKLIVSILALVEVCMTITSCQITYASDIVQETANSYIMPPNGFLRILSMYGAMVVMWPIPVLVQGLTLRQ